MVFKYGAYSTYVLWAGSSSVMNRLIAVTRLPGGGGGTVNQPGVGCVLVQSGHQQNNKDALYLQRRILVEKGGAETKQKHTHTQPRGFS